VLLDRVESDTVNVIVDVVPVDPDHAVYSILSTVVAADVLKEHDGLNEGDSSLQLNTNASPVRYPYKF
jgi:hypothetical protein